MSYILKLLEDKNNLNIYGVEDIEFKTYGRIIKGIDFSSCLSYMVQNTDIPEEGNVYVPSLTALETEEIMEAISFEIYGGMEVQIGYCNGKNTSLNGMEYHKGSEVLAAVTDCMLFLGHIWDMEENTFDTKWAQVFYVKAGQVIELYQTTLHLSPCRVYEEGFKAIIILPKGTNMDFIEPLERKTKEGQILLKKNKWIITHKEWEPLINQGAKPGIMGERIFLHCIEKERG